MNTDRKNSEAEIEKILRTPSKFTPPRGLKDGLIQQVPMLHSRVAPQTSIARPGSREWLRRWWPALVPGAISAACAMVLTTQQGTIRELKTSIQTFSQGPAKELNTTEPEKGASTGADSSADTIQEIERLREAAFRLKNEIAQLQQLQGENVKLQAEVAAPQGVGLSAEEAEELAKGKEKAQSIACVNNLKQFGLAVRIWALDNNDSNPPNVLCMSNELSTPKILVCPADTGHAVASDFFSFTVANCSYEFLAPSEVTDKEPQRVLSRCPIHGNIGLCDGSVQRGVAKDHPDWLVERDGKLYLATPNAAVEVRRQPNNQQEQINKFQQRYGITPENGPTTNHQP